MIKQKKCKGQNSAIGFDGCGKLFSKRTFGLCDSCLYDFYTTDERGKIIFEKRKIKVKAKNWKEEKAKMKESVKTLSDYKSDLQKEINLIVRLIDNGHGCIATGSKEGKQNAGHYISLGSNDTLRFHLENIWLQSEHSNMWKSGDTLRYQQGIINLFGKEYLEYMNSLQSIPVIKLTIEEIKLAIIECRDIIKELKSKDCKFSNEERKEIRKQLNIRIGIYDCIEKPF